MTESEVIDKVALVYGQMNEPPGARLRVGLSGLTMAEYFRDQGQDVLLFIDNIFRFVQAGSEVSALLGRMPSAVGYQPTLATEMGQLQERITSTRTGSVTSVQAIYVPADDLTDPAPANTFAHLDATTVLSRAIVEQGIYPAVDPLDSTSRALSRASSPRSTTDGDARAGDPAALQGPAGHHRDPRHGRALRRGQARRLAGPQDPALPLAAELRRRAVHRHARQVRQARGHDQAASSEIIEGKHDELPEQAFYMVGTIEEAVEKAEKLERRRSACQATGKTFDVSLVTPDGAAFEGEAEMLIVPGAAGEIGVLARHAPLVATLKAGSTRVYRDRDRGRRRVRHRAGFFKVELDRALALVDDAVDVKEIDDAARRRSSRRRRPSSSGSSAASRQPTAGSWSSASGTPRTSSRSRAVRPADEDPARSDRAARRPSLRPVDRCETLLSAHARRVPSLTGRADPGRGLKGRCASASAHSWLERMSDAPSRLTDLLDERIAVLDGSWGVLIQRDVRGEDAYRGERFRDHPQDVAGDPDLLNLTQPEIIARHPPRLLRRRRRHHDDEHVHRHPIGQADYGLDDRGRRDEPRGRAARAPGRATRPAAASSRARSGR